MKNWSLKTKLMSSFGLIAFLVALVSVISFLSMNRVTYDYGHVANIELPNVQKLGKLYSIQKNIVIDVMMLLGKSNTSEDLKKIQTALNEDIKSYEQVAKDYENHSFEPAEKEKWDEVNVVWKPFVEMSQKLLALSGTGSKADEELRDKLGNGEYYELRKVLRVKIESLIESQGIEAKKWATLAEDTAKMSNKVVILSSTLCVLFALTLGYLLSKYLVKAFMELSSSLANAAEQVSSSSSQIASASEELSQATVEQSTSLQETSSSIEEINSMINANTENARQSSIVSNQSLSTAEKGKVVIGHMIKAIGDINTSNSGIVNQINDTNKEIENIVKIINEIGSKTKVINDIVFQTKLLSFNASVEAARAGEQGKGFAVVAEEVGNLAAMSGAAALEITNMLDESIKTVEGIIRDSKEKIGKIILTGQEKVETGTRIAHECEEVLNEIVSSVASVTKMTMEISSASQEQAQGVNEITKAVAQLDQVTQQNTANAAESAGAAGALSNQAELLNSLVQNLVQIINGGKGAISHQTNS